MANKFKCLKTRYYKDEDRKRCFTKNKIYITSSENIKSNIVDKTMKVGTTIVDDFNRDHAIGNLWCKHFICIE